MFYGVSGWATWVREMFFDGDYGVAGATLGRYFSTFSLSSFLSLMKEKRAKENQGARGTCQVCRVREGAGVVFSEIGRVRDGAGVVFSEIGRVRDGAGVVFSEVGRVQDGAGVVFSEVGRVQDGVEVVFSNWGGQAKKIPAKRLDGGNLRVVANDGMDYVGDSASGAFRSKMERRM